MRKLLIGFLAVGLCVLGLGTIWIVRADNDDTIKFTAKLDGFQELGALNNETGAILAEGNGTLKLTLNTNAQTLAYELTYHFPSTGPNGATAVQQSHIHFGRAHTPGGIMVFFCTNLGNGPAGTPACPTPEGSVTGMMRAGITKVVGWHSFRRTFATLLKGSGEDVKTTQELMRHANSRITLDFYAQALTPAKRSAQKKVIELIQSAAVGAEA